MFFFNMQAATAAATDLAVQTALPPTSSNNIVPTTTDNVSSSTPSPPPGTETIRKTFQVNKVRQLIDLNGSTTNFHVGIRVSSKDRKPYDIALIDQTILDQQPELPYQHIDNGEYSGNLVQDKNVFQNYFLVMRADSPCDCDVEIVKTEIPPAQTQSSHEQFVVASNSTNSALIPHQPQSPLMSQATTTGSSSSSSGSSRIRYWLKSGIITALVVLGVYLVYRYYSKSNAGNKPAAGPFSFISATGVEGSSTAAKATIGLPSPPSPASGGSSSQHDSVRGPTSKYSRPNPSSSSIQNPVISRLKKLNINK